MIPIITLSYVARLLFITLLFTDFGRSNELTPANTSTGFAVVELFTSEGCSSCPAADETIIELSKEFSDNVYFLGYHVDYWNYLGWKDEFSSKVFTDRQHEYANEFNLNSIYTPQVVVNGKKELAGSDKSLLRQTIKDELKINPSITIELKAAKKSENLISVSYNVEGAGKDEQLQIALVQLIAVTNVKRGENRGHELKHINIVRELKIADRKSYPAEFTLPTGLSEKDIKFVAFVQDKKSLKINSAAEIVIK
jgi:hypothetical protein